MKEFYLDDSSKIYNNENGLDIENNLRIENNRISVENKLLKNMNQKLDNEIILNNFNNIESISKEKEKLNKSINRNSLLIYKILIDINDIYSLNNKIIKLNLNYDDIKLNKLIYDNKTLKYQKEKTEIKKIETFNKGNNLNLIYHNALKKKKNNQEIIKSFENIIDAFNFRNNYINDEKEANKKIDCLLNQKQQLIEDKIKIINHININKDIKGNKEEFQTDKINEDLNLLKIENKKLKEKLNKYNNIIKNMNSKLINNSNNKKEEIEINEKLNKANKNKDKINNEIEMTINNYKNEIKKKNKLMIKLKDKYIAIKKNELSSLDNIIFN